MARGQTGKMLAIGLGVAAMCLLGAGHPPATVGPTGTLPLVIYCALVVAASAVGGVLPNFLRLTHTRLQVMMSLIGGLMLGVGFLHQLPHAVVILSESGMPRALDWSAGWMLVGLVTMFFLLRMFHFHQHDAFEDDASHGHDCGGHDHDHDHAHDRHVPDPEKTGISEQPYTTQLPVLHEHGGPHATSWMGVALGLSLHTLTDGLALAAHVEADARHAAGLLLPGLATFLGIALHKPLDSLSITSLMTASGWQPWSRHLVNLTYALLCPAGVILFHLGLRSMSAGQNVFVGTALAFSAGVFVCISLSDLLPEVQFHTHDRWRLSLSLVAGLFVAWAIGFLEPEHTHGSALSPIPAHEHDHGHDH